MLLCVTNDEQLKIELLSQWKLEAEFRNSNRQWCNASDQTWWPTMEKMQMAPSGGQIWNSCKWSHPLIKFWTSTSETTYNWPNLEPMQVAFFLQGVFSGTPPKSSKYKIKLEYQDWYPPEKHPVTGEITQVKESIPWVRCASVPLRT